VNKDPLVILGNANEEGAKLREIKTKEPVKKNQLYADSADPCWRDQYSPGN